MCGERRGESGESKLSLQCEEEGLVHHDVEFATVMQEFRGEFRQSMKLILVPYRQISKQERKQRSSDPARGAREGSERGDREYGAVRGARAVDNVGCDLEDQLFGKIQARVIGIRDHVHRW